MNYIYIYIYICDQVRSEALLKRMIMRCITSLQHEWVPILFVLCIYTYTIYALSVLCVTCICVHYLYILYLSSIYHLCFIYAIISICISSMHYLKKFIIFCWIICVWSSHILCSTYVLPIDLLSMHSLCIKVWYSVGQCPSAIRFLCYYISIPWYCYTLTLFFCCVAVLL